MTTKRASAIDDRDALRRCGLSFAVCFFLLLMTIACREKPGHDKKESDPVSPERTPQEELATFQLPAGLKLQLVAAEPMIQDPVVITFDADGRMWVVEMRGFMPDMEGEGEDNRVGRISILEDTDGDGVMDKSIIYLDSLIMPRALAVVPGGALVAENGALWLTTDTNGDWRADKKTLIDSTYAGGPSPEHSGNGLWRNIDNWYYNAKSGARFQLVNGKWLRDSTEVRGQWGICNDDEGRLYYNYNWSQLHADLVPPNYLSANKHHTSTTGIDQGLTLDKRVYPIRQNPAVNRGYIPGTLNDEGKLQEFTAACSPLYFRGTSLPKEYYGNVFVCEPAGNLVKRNVIEKNGLAIKAHDPNPGTEFLASTDERFRPVFLSTGPDGALYVVDMYRGLIQHGSYVTPYLRDQTLARKLLKPINHGRIWRVVREGWAAPDTKKLSKASVSVLIATLSDPVGEQRDMAQALLVERGDKSNALPLAVVAKDNSNEHARLQALWTMQGLKVDDAALLLELSDDSSKLIRMNAIRLLEPIAKKDKGIRAKLEAILHKRLPVAPVDEVLQIALTARVVDPIASHDLLKVVTERYDTSALMRDGVISSLSNQEFTFLQMLWKSPTWEARDAGKEVFLEMLTTAIVRKADPSQMSSLLSMLKADASGWKDQAVLSGIETQGKNTNMKPIRLAAAPAFLANASSSSPYHSLVEMFEWPGHKAAVGAVPKKNPLDEKQQQQFVRGRQLYLTTCASCHGTDGNGLARFAPPLNGSDWVQGDDRRLALLVLHGMEGAIEVKGKHYDAPEILPVMPAHSTLDDGALTSILTYIRNGWSNAAGPVNPRLVGITRITSQGRVVPWSATELNKHIAETKPLDIAPPKKLK